VWESTVRLRTFVTIVFKTRAKGCVLPAAAFRRRPGLRISVQNTIQVPVDAQPDAGAGRYSHDGQSVAALNEGGQLRLGEGAESGGVALVIIGGRQVEQPMDLSLNGSIGDQIDVSGGSLALGCAPVALRRRTGDIGGGERARITYGRIVRLGAFVTIVKTTTCLVFSPPPWAAHPRSELHPGFGRCPGALPIQVARP